MKKALFALLLATGFLGIGCDHPSSVTPNSTSPGSPNVHDLLLRADSAHRYVHVFDSLCKSKFNDTPIIAYTIRSLDLLTAMGIRDSLDTLARHKFVRVYLGFDPGHKPHMGF